MHSRVSDSVIVITGASTGIGRATALELARARATVVLVSRRAAVLERLARECRELGGRALAQKADVTDADAVKAAAREATEAFGRIDAWINNAAVTLFGRLEECPPEAFRQVIETNFFGYVHGARAVLPYFRAQGRGTLVNVSSVAGRIAQPYTSAYSASKFAIIGLSQSLRMELDDAPDIHVCTVLPASIDTPLFQHGANFTGRSARPLQPVYSAAQVAREIVALLQHPRRETVVGNAGRLGLIAHAIAPGAVESVLPGHMRKRHFLDRRSIPGTGNLFEPMDRYESVSGGWRSARQRRISARVVFGVAAFALGTLALFARSKR